jgi:hypothetical protein
MNISISMRSDKLLADLRTSIVTYITDPHIYFYGNEIPEYLCAVPFIDVIPYSIDGGIAKYRFMSNDGAILRNIVERNGVVKSFKIHGKVESGDSVDESFIEGSVGGLTSSADMRFNRISWSAGMNITISDLYMVMK